MSNQDDLRIGAVILAAGKGTRMKSTEANKVALLFHGKPIIAYGVEVTMQVAQHVVVVVGALAESVKKSLSGFPVEFAEQKEQLGTGHALQVGFKQLASTKPDVVLVGYGDHMMFYKTERIRELVELHRKENADLSFITALHDDPSSLGWARILRNKNNEVIGIVEQRDATEEQKKIKEFNPGLFCFNSAFLEEFLPQITKSPVTQEYYLTELLELGFKRGKKIVAMPVPFSEVGIGINRPEELQESQSLYRKLQK